MVSGGYVRDALLSVHQDLDLRIASDVGGTFTDVVVAGPGWTGVGKAPTSQRGFEGLREAVEMALMGQGLPVAEAFKRTSLLMYSTTLATNAVLEAKTARTAQLVTAGFPDVLVYREGGGERPFDLSKPVPEPYIPRRLTFEIPERVNSEGEVVKPLDEAVARRVLRALRERGIEALAVSLLWSIANSRHERRLGELIAEELPGVPFTLSHEINPIIREYRRASSAAVDASLKPLIADYLQGFLSDLKAAGFGGELMIGTSFGGRLTLDEAAARPLHMLRSGPSMAPVAGRRAAEEESERRDLIVCDAGGTSFDVSLVRDGAISYSRDVWIGPRFTGHLTGSSAVDVRSVGTGGGSIAWIDSGGLLRVGPRSAGSHPGPACYSRGGTEPTVTDAAVVLGYIDPERFLGGRMSVNAAAAERVFDEFAARLGLAREATAEAVLTVANEQMVTAIQEITIHEGLDPKEMLILAGGGAIGLTVVALARELGVRDVLVPRTGGVLSAMGGLISEIVVEFSQSGAADTSRFDYDAVNRILGELEDRAQELSGRLRDRGISEARLEYLVEARYAGQVWELEVPLATSRFEGEAEVKGLSAAFDEIHERTFTVVDRGAPVECETWKLRFHAPVARSSRDGDFVSHLANGAGSVRHMYFNRAWRETSVVSALPVGGVRDGPLVVAAPTTTLVIPPGARIRSTAARNYHVEVEA
jgi:N-methylhydantoinase A